MADSLWLNTREVLNVSVINILMIAKFFTSFVIASLVLSMGMPLVNASRPATTGDEDVDALKNEVAREIADEVIFDNIASLAGSSCSLYSLSVDLVNIAYDGQWSFIDSMLELSVLFRNEPWREIIWAVSDKREAFITELTKLKKQRCLLGFAKPEAIFDNQEEKRLQQIAELEKNIAEMEMKAEYFAIQKRNMLFDKPHFGSYQENDEEIFFAEPLQVDKIFYILGGFTSLDVNFDQFIQSSKRVIADTREDLAVVATNMPADCFAVVTVGHEIDLYFSTKFRYENGVFRDDTGREYDSFKAFIDDNGAVIVQQYIERYCSSARNRALTDAELTGAKEQFLDFQNALNQIIDQVSQQLQSLERQISTLEKQQQDGLEIDTDKLKELNKIRGRWIGIKEYHQLVLQKVGSSESQSLDAIAKSLEDFSSAVLGVIKDDDDKKKSRISLAERMEKANERSLKKICTRIEAMYREAGRSTADLPVIGYANGREYCKAKPECADVGLGNLVGGTEGRKKLAECSGFLFDQSELGNNQNTDDVIQADAEDIGLLLEQRALNDLLKQRNIHFTSLRGKYKGLYGAQSDTTKVVEKLIKEAALDLYNPKVPEVYNPEGNAPQTHFSLIQHIYREFKKFIDEQKGSCSAPDEPKV